MKHKGRFVSTAALCALALVLPTATGLAAPIDPPNAGDDPAAPVSGVSSDSSLPTGTASPAETAEEADPDGAVNPPLPAVPAESGAAEASETAGEDGADEETTSESSDDPGVPTALRGPARQASSTTPGAQPWKSSEKPFPTGSHAFPGNDGKSHKVTWDSHSLMIDGDPLHLWAGEFHPWRLPSPEAWRDLLQKMKSAGFNGVSFYFHWGLRQSEEGGEFNFEGIRDVDKLLTMAEEEGLYVIVRPGPYINAETSMGGLPAYMTNFPARLRSNDARSLKASKSWLKAFNTVVKEHLITSGKGSVIMYQVENEMLNDGPDNLAFVKNLADFVRGDGIDVPIFENDYGLGGRFAPEKKDTGTDFYTYDRYPLGFTCSAQRKDITDTEETFRRYSQNGPHYIVEGQGGSFTPWGAGFTPERCRDFTDDAFTRQWGVTNIGNGVTLFAYYMLFGGTNWGWTGAPASGFTSYDYGAGITEDRTLTKKYAVQKELGYYQQGVTAFTRSDPIRPVNVTKLTGNTPIHGYQRLTADSTIYPSATGNGTRLLGFRLADSRRTDDTTFTVGLDLTDTQGVGAKFTTDDTNGDIAYSSGWSTQKDPTAYRGTVHRSSAAGETATYTFSGTGVQVVVATGTDHGKFAVSVDGGVEQTATGWVDTEQNKPEQFVALTIDGLTAGKHTVTVKNLGEPGNSSATGTIVDLDALNVIDPEPVTPWDLVNNNDSAISFTGNWTYASGQSWTSGDHNDDETFSNTAGDYYEYRFTGVGIDVVAPYSGNHGSATVYLDGKEVGKTSEEVTAQATWQQDVFSKRDLQPGSHTLKVVVDGQPFPNSQGQFVTMDYLRVFPDQKAVEAYENQGAIPDGPLAWSRVPQKEDTALHIHGRDAIQLTADMKIADHELLYTTSQIFGAPIETDEALVQYLIGYPGDPGETVLRYDSEPTVTGVDGADLPAEVEVNWDAERGALRLNYVHGAKPLDLVVTGEGSDKPLRLRLIDRDYGEKTWLIATGTGSSTERVAVEGVELARTLTIKNETASVTGTVTEAGEIQILLPAGVNSASWNGGQTGKPAESDAGFARFNVEEPAAITIPELSWVKQEGAPEIAAEFDDSDWLDASDPASAAANGSQQPALGGVVLDSNHYKQFEGSVWYRASFTANGNNPTLTLKGSGGHGVPNHGRNPAFMQVWANGQYLGWRSAAGQDQRFTLSGIRNGDPVKLAVLVHNLGQNLDWSDNGLSKQTRGLNSASVPAQDGTLRWKIQGAADPTGKNDPARGMYNVGGLFGEREGWYLPGLDDSEWSPAANMHADQPGVAWYRTTFDLDVPPTADVAFHLDVDSSRFAPGALERNEKSQVTLFVNGWNTGVYIGDIGPQTSFTVPRAFLHTTGKNVIAVAVAAKEAEMGPDTVALRVKHVSDSQPGTPVNVPTPDPLNPSVTVTTATEGLANGQVYAGDAISLEATGFWPSTDVVITAVDKDGKEIQLGTYPTNESGELSVDVTMPGDAAVSDYRIILTQDKEDPATGKPPSASASVAVVEKTEPDPSETGEVPGGDETTAPGPQPEPTHSGSPSKPGKPGGKMPVTGSNAVGLGFAALALVLAGGALVAVRRRGWNS